MEMADVMGGVYTRRAALAPMAKMVSKGTFTPGEPTHMGLKVYEPLGSLHASPTPLPSSLSIDNDK